MCCPGNQEEMRAALEAGRERELGLRELIGRLLRRPAAAPPTERDATSGARPAAREAGPG